MTYSNHLTAADTAKPWVSLGAAAGWNRQCRRALHKPDAAHSTALRNTQALLLELTVLKQTGDVSVQQLAALQANPQQAAQQRMRRCAEVNRQLQQAMLLVQETAQALLQAADEWQPPAPPPAPDYTLPSDHLSETCAASSERKRNRTPDSQLCMRRAACVGTSAPAAPPAVVSNNGQQHRLVLTTPGESPPM